MIQRFLDLLGALAFTVVAVAFGSQLPHPSRITAVSSNPCAGRGLADALTYALGAVIVTAAVLCVVSLVRRTAPRAVAYAGLGLLVLGFFSRRTTTRVYACVGNPQVNHSDQIAVVLAVLGSGLVFAGWRTLGRPRG